MSVRGEEEGDIVMGKVSPPPLPSFLFSFGEIGDENEISLAALIFCNGGIGRGNGRRGIKRRARLGGTSELAESLRDEEGLWVRQSSGKRH